MCPIIATPKHVVTYPKAAIGKTESTYCLVGFVDFEHNDGNISEGAWCKKSY